jgi:hypothetical protein
MEHGIIREFQGSWQSGLGHLVIEDVETGITQAVPCDNGPTVQPGPQGGHHAK